MLALLPSTLKGCHVCKLANPYQNFLQWVLFFFPLYKGENKYQGTFSYFSVKHYTCKKTIVYGGPHSITLA